ncbi:hypothetical protein [Streptomyces sp. NPDC047042]
MIDSADSADRTPPKPPGLRERVRGKSSRWGPTPEALLSALYLTT